MLNQGSHSFLLWQSCAWDRVGQEPCSTLLWLLPPTVTRTGMGTQSCWSRSSQGGCNWTGCLPHISVCAQPLFCIPCSWDMPVRVLLVQSRLMIQLSYVGNLVTSTASKGAAGSAWRWKLFAFSPVKRWQILPGMYQQVPSLTPRLTFAAASPWIAVISGGASSSEGSIHNYSKEAADVQVLEAPQYQITAGTKIMLLFPLLKKWRPTEKSEGREAPTLLLVSQDLRQQSFGAQRHHYC